MLARLAPLLRRRLRLALLAVLLVCGQAAMLAHAAEHAGDGDAAPHVCLACVAGHNLDGPAPGTSALPQSTPSTVEVPPAALTATLPRRFVACVRARAPPA